MKAAFPSQSVGAMLWITCLLSALVLTGGLVLARRTERLASPPPGNRIDDTFRQAISHLTDREKQWEEALEKETEELLEGRRGEWIPRTIGAVRLAEVNARQAPPESAPPDGVPILEKYAKGTPGEWTLDWRMDYGKGFQESPGHPLIYARGNGRKIMVLILDRGQAAEVAMKELQQDVAYSFKEEPGRFEWRANASRPDPTGEARPDEILRHVSRFGNIELRRWYPVKTVVSYHIPTVAGAFTLSSLLVVTGLVGASSLRRVSRLAEERVSFVNRVSHELRSPLTNLLLNADLALDELSPADEKVRRRLGLIREETGRLSRIVDNVLAFARLERRTGQPAASTCEPALLIAEVKENFAPLFARKGIQCEWRIDLHGPAVIDGDAFSQILSNLLSNVEKYAGAEACCRITAARAGDELTLTVADNGPGIPGEARGKIFKPFMRVRESTSEGVSGTGLGLAISRELAMRMGGRLDLLDTKEGASFRLVIPLQGKEPA